MSSHQNPHYNFNHRRVMDEILMDIVPKVIRQTRVLKLSAVKRICIMSESGQRIKRIAYPVESKMNSGFLLPLLSVLLPVLLSIISSRRLHSCQLSRLVVRPRSSAVTSHRANAAARRRHLLSERLSQPGLQVTNGRMAYARPVSTQACRRNTTNVLRQVATFLFSGHALCLWIII